MVWDATKPHLLEHGVSKRFVIQFDNGDNPPFWLADWEGDPGRTLLPKNAKRFSSHDDAQLALNDTIKENPHRKLVGYIQPINVC